jgi:arylsulfatase
MRPGNLLARTLASSVAVAALAGAAAAQGAPGAPSATATINGLQLPPPPVAFGGEIGIDTAGSTP